MTELGNVPDALVGVAAGSGDSPESTAPRAGAAPAPTTGAPIDPDGIAARVREARKSGKGTRRRVSKPFRELVRADRRLSRAAHRLARAAAKGLRTYRDEQQASAEKKRDGAVRDQPKNAAKGLADAMLAASRVPLDVVRAMSTRTGVRVLRRTARLMLAPLL